MKYSEYWKEVHGIADTLLEECEGETDDERREWLSDRLHETIDGHEWIIYTASHFLVLGHSDNAGYSVENFGAEGVMKDGVLDTAFLAFGALYGDVSDYLWRQYEEKQ